MELPVGAVIRVCLNKKCEAVYVDTGKNHDNLKLCKVCNMPTGFYDSLDKFYNYVDMYGLNTDTILDKKLKAEVENHYE